MTVEQQVAAVRRKGGAVVLVLEGKVRLFLAYGKDDIGIAFSPAQARALAVTLVQQADEAEKPTAGDGPK